MIAPHFDGFLFLFKSCIAFTKRANLNLESCAVAAPCVDFSMTWRIIMKGDIRVCWTFSLSPTEARIAPYIGLVVPVAWPGRSECKPMQCNQPPISPLITSTHTISFITPLPIRLSFPLYLGAWCENLPRPLVLHVSVLFARYCTVVYSIMCTPTETIYAGSSCKLRNIAKENEANIYKREVTQAEDVEPWSSLMHHHATLRFRLQR